jgi:hypothetical protein
MPKQKMMLRSRTGLEALILTFSLREKGPARALGEFSLKEKGSPLALGEFSLREKGSPLALGEFSLREKGPPVALGELSPRKKRPPLPSSPSGRRIKDEGKGEGPSSPPGRRIEDEGEGEGLGEGWGEGNSIFENDRGRRDTPRSLASAKIRRRVQTSPQKRC